jgi:uncharacterized protein (DUF433 family)
MRGNYADRNNNLSGSEHGQRKPAGFVRKSVDWRIFIHSDSDILGGKPVVKGTRLSVDFILRLFANGWTFQEIFESYPRLSPEAIQAVFAYAGEM